MCCTCVVHVLNLYLDLCLVCLTTRDSHFNAHACFTSTHTLVSLQRTRLFHFNAHACFTSTHTCVTCFTLVSLQRTRLFHFNTRLFHFNAHACVTLVSLQRTRLFHFNAHTCVTCFNIVFRHRCPSRARRHHRRRLGQSRPQRRRQIRNHSPRV